MNKLTFFLLVFVRVQFVSLSSFCEDRHAHGVLIGDSVQIFAHSRDAEPINTYYSEVQGNVLFSDYHTDNYYTVSIIKQKNNRYLVDITPIYDFDEAISLKKVWIYAENVGVGFAQSACCESDMSNMIIYDKPSCSATYRYVSFHTESYIANLLAIKKKWLKVVVFDGKSYLAGWVAPENQNLNMYSMCIGN